MLKLILITHFQYYLKNLNFFSNEIEQSGFLTEFLTFSMIILYKMFPKCIKWIYVENHS